MGEGLRCYETGVCFHQGIEVILPAPSSKSRQTGNAVKVGYCQYDERL